MTTNDGSGRSVFARYIVDSPPEAKQRGSTLPRGPLLFRQPITNLLQLSGFLTGL
jgi:hypothetical protein